MQGTSVTAVSGTRRPAYHLLTPEPCTKPVSEILKGVLARSFSPEGRKRMLREHSLRFKDREHALLARKAFGIPHKVILELTQSSRRTRCCAGTDNSSTKQCKRSRCSNSPAWWRIESYSNSPLSPTEFILLSGQIRPFCRFASRPCCGKRHLARVSGAPLPKWVNWKQANIRAITGPKTGVITGGITGRFRVT
jgi:hypothetical protein